MSTHKDFPKPIGDTEARHQAVADPSRGGLGAESSEARLADSWSDLERSGEQPTNRDGPRSSSAVPLLDEMKGILQWD